MRVHFIISGIVIRICLLEVNQSVRCADHRFLSENISGTNILFSLRNCVQTKWKTINITWFIVQSQHQNVIPICRYFEFFYFLACNNEICFDDKFLSIFKIFYVMAHNSLNLLMGNKEKVIVVCI